MPSGLAAAPGPAGLLEPPLEALDPAAGVHQLLLARVERVAVRAHLDVQLGLRAARDELVAAGAATAAALLAGKVELEPGSKVAAVVSGGNVAPEAAVAILAER